LAGFGVFACCRDGGVAVAGGVRATGVAGWPGAWCGLLCRGGAGLAGWLWRPGCERGETGAPPFAGAGRQAGGGAAGVVVLAGLVGGEDALVADG
jgi:hypothetical protein